MTNKSRHPFPKRVSVFFRLTEGVLCAEEISDNLAGYKRVICLNVKILQRNAPARSYEKTYNLAGVLAVQYQCNALSISALHLV